MTILVTGGLGYIGSHTVRALHERGDAVVVLDDLGAEWGSSYVTSKIDAIFSERYNRKKSTIVTTNLAGQALRSRYPDRIIDRLRETTQIITFNTEESLRLSPDES